MKSNLAHEPTEPQGEVVRFPKKERQAMAEKFSQGFVQSSQLYRKEVYPFLSDAARHVYFELESKINGFHKDSDFVSYSQLQGNSDLEGARTMSRMTVAKGVKELADHGVITILATHRKLGNKYQINEVSLLGKQYTKKTSTPSELVHVVDRTSTRSRPQVVHVVDTQKKDLNIFIKEREEEEVRTNFQAQNRTLNFIEYHTQDRVLISFKNLCQKYSVEQDFIAQAKVSFPNHTEQQIQKVLSDLAQWSLSASNHTPQKWMNIWLDFMKREPSAQEKRSSESKKYQPASSKNSQTMKAHDEFFAQHGIGSNFESDFIDVHATEIKTIGGNNQ
ncbi:hypothetical protein [Acinetobacter sp. CFCC 10889]|uniref:hypothetical protein n=1 Tax=Acinetobacter sp. CFCC 10889 TaxID=1775557 RepID=UPI000DCFEA32|nr:hypothetical protein [Acinetobacter sp. CFCC 10889]